MTGRRGGSATPRMQINLECGCGRASGVRHFRGPRDKGPDPAFERDTSGGPSGTTFKLRTVVAAGQTHWVIFRRVGPAAYRPVRDPHGA